MAGNSSAGVVSVMVEESTTQGIQSIVFNNGYLGAGKLVSHPAWLTEQARELYCPERKLS